MSRTDYYKRMQALARATRQRFEIRTVRVQISDLRRMFKAEGVRVDLWSRFSNRLRGAYFHDAHGPTVVVNQKLPTDPRVFTMAHELKHHLVDQERAQMFCDSTAAWRDEIEIGAEIFAAELIFPEAEFLAHFAKQECTAEALVRLKRETGTTLSYQGLAKRAAFNGLVAEGAFKRVQWKKLEERLYGPPIHVRIGRGRRSAVRSR